MPRLRRQVRVAASPLRLTTRLNMGHVRGWRHEAVAGRAQLAGRLVVHGRPGAAGRHPGHCRRGPPAVAGGEPVRRPQARTADVLFRRAPFRLCAASVAVLLAVSLLSPARVRRLALAVLLVALALMVLVLLVGAEINGARRWLHVGGYSLQPSEFAKPAFVVLSAWLLAEGARRPDMPAMPLAVCLYLVFACLLVLQPDVGQALLVSLVWAALFLLAGRPLRWFFAACGGARLRCAGGLHEPRLRALAHRRFLHPTDRRQLPDRPGAAILHRGRLLRQGPGRGHHQERAARRPYRLHLRRHRRGVRRARLPGAPRPVRPGGGAGVLAPHATARDGFCAAGRRPG